MTWTYDITMASDMDKVRFKVGDTDSAFPQLSNEEITALLVGSTVLQASIQVVKFLIGKYSLRANETVGKISVNYSNVVTSLKVKLDDLTKESAGAVNLYAGGISVSDKDSIKSNTDNVKPAFTRELHSAESQSKDDD